MNMWITRRRRALGALLVGLFVALLALAGAGTAHAVGEACDAGTDKPITIAPVPDDWTAPVGVKNPNLIGKPGYGATALEWFGSDMAFLTTTVWDGDNAPKILNDTCTIGANLTVGVGVAVDLVWNIAGIANYFALSMYSTVMNFDMVDFFGGMFYSLADGVTTEQGITVGSLNSIYTQMLAVIIAGSAVWLVVMFLRRRVKEGLTGVFGTMVAAFAGLVILSSPGFLTDATQTAMSATTDVANTAATSISKEFVGNGDNVDYCTLADDVLANPRNGQRKHIREAVCQMWVTTYLEPWIHGQFGMANPRGTVVDIETGDVTVMDEPIYIPGLKTQPPADDLVALHLTTMKLTPAEQRWLDDARVNFSNKGNGVGATAKRRLMGGYGIYEGDGANQGVPEGTEGWWEDPELSKYPADGLDIAMCGGDADCIQLKGHQFQWQVLRDRATSSGNESIVPLTWTGTSGASLSARTDATSMMVIGTVTLNATVLLFGIPLLWYQFLLGFGLVFLFIPLLGMAIPGWGPRVFRDVVSRLLQLIVMIAVTSGFMIAAVTMATVLPARLTGMLGSGLAAGNAVGMHYFRAFAALFVVVLMFVLWRKFMKSISRKAMIQGANVNSGWNVGDSAASKAASTVGSVGKVAAGVTIGAVATPYASAALGAVSNVRKSKRAQEKFDKENADADGAPDSGAPGASVTGGNAGTPSSGEPAGMGGPVTSLSRPGAAGAAAAGSRYELLTPRQTPAPAAGPVKERPAVKSWREEYAAIRERQQEAGGIIDRLNGTLASLPSVLTSALINGKGMSSVGGTLKSSMNEVVTGKQVSNIVTDSKGRTSIIETGFDQYRAVHTPAADVQSAVASGIRQAQQESMQPSPLIVVRNWDGKSDPGTPAQET